MSAIRWNPWGVNYAGKEIEQMQFVHRVYLEAMGIEAIDLPPTLQMNATFTAPLFVPTKASFDEHTFVRQMQGVVGLLRQPAEEIISCICGYQKERADRFQFGSGYMNDPRTLLLEEIKEWAMSRLAPAACTTESVERDVEKRKNYITQLQYVGGDLFAPGSGERSLLKTLKDIREILENRVLPTIACERAQASAKDHLTVVEARATDALIHGVQFLFNVFRNTGNAPADCTITNLQSQQHSAMKDAMTSKSGQMLQLLLSTPSFCKLFPESHHHVTGGESKLMALTSEQQLQIQSDAVFCDSAATAIVPAILTPKEMTPKAFLTQSNSGVITFLTPEDYDMYTKMHGLLKLLADLVVSCRQARLLAGTGGDLLVYGPGGAHLRLLLETMQAVQMEIVQCATTLKQRGVAELDKLRSSYSEKNWRICFSRVLALETYLTNDVSACNDPIRKICEATTPAYVLQQAKEFKAQTSKWVVENASACSHIADTLHLKGLPPMPQITSSQMRTITAG
ncbi:hypothetical protein SDRG_13049 [Saprolegnia diclina VS20]|uniref:Uncharacterized protein n=1 Tax=Saprolegnia diclina (strain VS20) TaxID=1156394 RepID=T0Q3L0_SAPDV|nr:hypothetical protein SDRG_13049 [Saprolegnia diclina VS20]EQC29176.1 hypothetical protein SDRG_13049 [Saprolegnia diclina VS20]|eukprot:XP_008617354.1 hypothetical protein SDRG_13049 [Saprolegnia diclina VS20]